ncbi:hypothetical protein MPC1_11300001 [Methylocella tundrae]|nr:hypothetical protein MPC1_11300001 [Methylocella tundrae]
MMLRGSCACATLLEIAKTVSPSLVISIGFITQISLCQSYALAL